MRIKSIELCGFKSFPDRTVLRFDSNVTAVVGPNGCGKSNLVDAIRWAMGEQSYRTLRGRQMDDVIFGGSEARSATAMSEVTLTFSAEDGMVPVKYAGYREIAVSRRMFRDGGESSYFINKVPVRLRDVTDLFLGTGAGTRAYSLIEQGRVGQIVTARPQDRRLLIEEAAGISRYRTKRIATERQIAATEQNLVRIGDRLRDKEEMMAGLRRQAQKAARFRAYRDEMRAIDLLVAAHDALARLATAAMFDRERSAVLETLDFERAGLAAAEARFESERALLAEMEAAVQAHQTEVYEAGNGVRISEAEARQARVEIARLRERAAALAEQRSANVAAIARAGDELAANRGAAADAAEALRTGEAALAAADARLGDRRGALRSVEEDVADARRMHVAAVQADEQIRGAIDATEAAQIERRRRRVETAERRDEMARRIAESRAAAADAAGALARASSRLAGERTRADALRAEIEGLRVALAGGDATVQERRIEVERAASRLASLVEIIDRHEAYGAGVRALLDRATAPDVPRMFPLGDLVSCEDGYEAALAAALGDTLQRLVCDLRGDADEALRYLREAALGRAAVTPREGWAPAGAGAKCSAPPGAEPLSERVRAEAPVADLVAAALSGVFVVSSLREAEALRAADHRAVFVTRSGELLYPDGTMCGGSAEDRFASFLHAKSERSLLEGALPSLRAALDAALAGQESLRARLRDVRCSFDAASAAAHQAEVEATRVAADLAATEEAGRRSMEDAAEADALVRRLDAGIAEADGSIAGLLIGRETAARRLAAVDGAVARLAVDVEAARAAAEEAAAAHASERERVAEARARAAALRGLAESLERRLAEMERDNVLFDQEADANASHEGTARGRLVAVAEALVEQTVRHDRLGDALRMAQASFDAQRAAIHEIELEIKARRDRVGVMTERLAGVKGEAEAAAREVAFLAERLAERHQVGLDDAISAHHMTPPPDENARRRADELRSLIDRMGGVNLMAIEEYEDVRRVVDGMARQKQDLEKALTDLRAAIQRMNRESRVRFRATFDAVNDLFQKVFPKMFRGGRAHLELTESDDILDAGIEIVAQPPGKKLQSIDLLSGGEKALTAVSLVFALFLYKPSPFCVLDEVDAPLDDANVGRFCDFLHELADRTQFVLVTHVKQTMERADVLYGVTMEEPGVSKIVSVRLRDGERGVRAA